MKTDRRRTDRTPGLIRTSEGRREHRRVLGDRRRSHATPRPTPSVTAAASDRSASPGSPRQAEAGARGSADPSSRPGCRRRDRPPASSPPSSSRRTSRAFEHHPAPAVPATSSVRSLRLEATRPDVPRRRGGRASRLRRRRSGDAATDDSNAWMSCTGSACRRHQAAIAATSSASPSPSKSASGIDGSMVGS